MMDRAGAKYVQLRERDGQYLIALLDENKVEVGTGYKGPTQKRAEQDLKYWTKTKGMVELLA